MAKRVNPHRRLLAEQMTLRRVVQSDGNAADRGKLQEGRVRSPLNPVIQLTGYSVGRPAVWENMGVAGKIVRGQLKRTRPGTKSRFAPK